MRFRVGRTISPAAAPIPLGVILKALFFLGGKSGEHDEFENDLRRELSIDHCFLLSSGKAALTLTLLALKVLFPDRDEVLIPAHTCYSVPASINRAGLKIKLCDVGPNSLDLDKAHLKNLIDSNRANPKLLCVVATHLFGCPADIKGIKSIVGGEIPIIEDAAQSMGEVTAGVPLGTHTDVGFFSLGRGKALSTIEGGIIVTNRADLGEALSTLYSKLNKPPIWQTAILAGKALLTFLLQHPNMFWIPKSIPHLGLGETHYQEDFAISELSSFQKKLGSQWGTRLNRDRTKRKRGCHFWRESVRNSIYTPLCNNPEASLLRFPVLCPDHHTRNGIIESSEKEGCGIMPTYPTPINEIPQLCKEFQGQDFPNAKALTECMITLPVHIYVKDKDQEKILALLKVHGHS